MTRNNEAALIVGMIATLISMCVLGYLYWTTQDALQESKAINTMLSSEIEDLNLNLGTQKSTSNNLYDSLKATETERDELKTQIDNLKSEIETLKNNSYTSTTSTNTSEVSSDALTASKGVNYFNGNRETYYSSNVLRHYRTDEWTPDVNGVYRDSDNYVVVASSDLAHGSTIATSHGLGKVYDSGCASGTVDIYTNW